MCAPLQTLPAGRSLHGHSAAAPRHAAPLITVAPIISLLASLSASTRHFLPFPSPSLAFPPSSSPSLAFPPSSPPSPFHPLPLCPPLAHRWPTSLMDVRSARTRHGPCGVNFRARHRGGRGGCGGGGSELLAHCVLTPHRYACLPGLCFPCTLGAAVPFSLLPSPPPPPAPRPHPLCAQTGRCVPGGVATSYRPNLSCQK